MISTDNNFEVGITFSSVGIFYQIIVKWEKMT